MKIAPSHGNAEVGQEPLATKTDQQKTGNQQQPVGSQPDHQAAASQDQQRHQG